MDARYFLNDHKTAAYKLVGQMLTKVEFSASNFNNIVETDCRITHQKIGLEDEKKIMARNIETTQKAFDVLITKAIAFGINQLTNEAEPINIGNITITEIKD